MRVCLVTLALGLALVGAQARDNGQYANVDPAIKNWINGLKDAAGTSCCSTADGYQPEEVVWDADTKGYWVHWQGKRLQVPDSAVIKEPNRLGYPVVWIGYNGGEPFVRCFLPGGGA